MPIEHDSESFENQDESSNEFVVFGIALLLLAAIMILSVFGIFSAIAAAHAGLIPAGFDGCKQLYDIFANSPNRILSSRASDAPLGQYPFAVSLQSKDKTHICSGVLITENRVLTSAQCAQVFDECNLKNIEAVLGAWNLTDENEIKNHQQRIPLAKITPDPNYSKKPPPHLSDDLAIISLAQHPNLNKRVQPLELRSPIGSDSDPSQNLLGRKCRMISWGNAFSQENEVELERKRPAVLQQEDLILIENKECNEITKGINLVDDGMLCGAMISNDFGTRQECDDPSEFWSPTGDTGSALICPLANKEGETSYILAGITSWGNIPCTSRVSKRVIVFTRISRYISGQLFVQNSE